MLQVDWGAHGYPTPMSHLSMPIRRRNGSSFRIFRCVRNYITICNEETVLHRPRQSTINKRRYIGNFLQLIFFMDPTTFISVLHDAASTRRNYCVGSRSYSLIITFRQAIPWLNKWENYKLRGELSRLVPLNVLLPTSQAIAIL